MLFQAVLMAAKYPALAIMFSLLVACGGGGSSSGSTNTASAAAPASTAGAEVGIDSVVNESEHYLVVYFSGPVARALNSDDFIITDDLGAVFEVVDIQMADDGAEGRLVISPGSATSRRYSLEHPDLPGETFTFDGNPIKEPELESVVTLSPTQLLLSFDASISINYANEIANYTIYPAQDGERIKDELPLDISAAELLGDSTLVILTTETQDNSQYIVIVENITNEGDIYINPKSNTAVITGMGEEDEVAPSIPRILRVDPTEILVNFSEPVCRSGGDSSHYAVNYCLPVASEAACAPGATVFDVFVNSVELNGYCTQAKLNVSYIPALAVVNLNVTNVIDNGGNVLNTAIEVPPVIPEITLSSAPRLSSAISLSPTRVLLTFDVSIAAESANNAAFYRVIVSQDGRPRIDMGELNITAATLQADSRTVLLTTETQRSVEYYVNATNLSNEPGDTYIDPAFNAGVFFGIGADDNVAPLVKKVVQSDPAQFFVDFSEPLCDSAADASNYTLNYCVPEEGLDTCSGGETFDLAVKSVTLNEFCTRAQLDTSVAPANAVISLVVTDVVDGSGNAILSNKNVVNVTFEEELPVSLPDEPRVVGAISTSNTTIRVAFSNVMGDSAIESTNYSIVQVNVNGEAGALWVTAAAFTSSSETSVELTTLSQNDVTYRVSAVGVTDEYGQAFAVNNGNLGFFSANTAEFAGTPPEGGAVIDTDGDGLADNEEQRGWLVIVRNANGSETTREVTSDPFVADSDGDGLSDKVERGLGTDPRNKDTDADGLVDAHEYNGIFSNPANQDTDGDGLGDGEEVTFYNTSPLLDDTDGDQLFDNDEVVLANRNARIADLPQPAFEIESLSLFIDVRFDEVNENGSTEIDQKSVSTTFTQASEKTHSKSSEVSDKVSAEVTASTQLDIGAVTLGIPTAKIGLEVKAGYEHSWSSSWSDSSSNSTQDEYNKSLSTSAEVSQQSSLTRRVEAAEVSTLLYLYAEGDIAFTISNLQITALVADVRNPGRFIPLATLTPENPVDNYNLGPLADNIGPLRFVSRDVFPAQVERLQRDPTGVIFKISNYDITDENGRNFAYTSQDVTDRTTAVTLDFGGIDSDGDGLGETSERYRVATSFGRNIGSVVDSIAADQGVTPEDVRQAYGLEAGDVDSIIAYDLSGKNLGVVFHDVMQNVLGLEHYDEGNDTGSSLEQYNSYATSVNLNGIERVSRVRQAKSGPEKTWSLLTPSGLILDGQLSFGAGEITADDQALLPGTGITLAFVADEDGDHIPARLEYLNRCKDTAVNSDGDNLSDYFEVFGEPQVSPGVYANPANRWIVDIKGVGTYEGFSSCASDDSDADGLSDDEEYALRTDAKKQDTDEDGVTDTKEVRGWLTYLEGSLEPGDNPQWTCVLDNGAPVIGGLTAVTCSTDPLNPDTDGDGISDGSERHWNANPTVDDFDDVTDLDGDGLLGFEEKAGLSVSYTKLDGSLSATCSVSNPVGCAVYGGNLPTSDVDKADTDSDGLRDDVEYSIETHPRWTDTDLDGILDDDEFHGETADPLGAPGDLIVINTDPLRQDTDGDGFADGDELTPWTVSVQGSLPYEVYSDPGNPNSDLDGLNDFQERDYKTDPRNPNTDSDIFTLLDDEEVALGLKPLDPGDICLKVTYTWITTAVNDGFKVKLRIFTVEGGDLTTVFSATRTGNVTDDDFAFVRVTSGLSVKVQAYDPEVKVSFVWRKNDPTDIAKTYTNADFTPSSLGVQETAAFSNFASAAASKIDVHWRVDVAHNVSAGDYCASP